MRNKRYIITGGGGSGKTTIINQLQDLGFNTYPEVSRALIKEQQTINGSLLPWMDLYGFGIECLQRMQEQLSTTKNDVCFFDRGIPDIQAYFNARGIIPQVNTLKNELQYAQTVFICPPWHEIFINDPQRPESFDYSCQIYDNLKRVYSNLGYQLVEVPKTDIEDRVRFIINQVQGTPHFKGKLNSQPSVAR